MMNKIVLLSVVAMLAVGCATSSPPATKSSSAPAARAPKYSANEKTQLTICMGLTDTAKTVADLKRQGLTAQQIKDRRTTGPMLETYRATVDKVFGDTFEHPLDYAMSFFGECALNMADVPKERVNFASYCMMNSIIASTAQTYKASGLPKEDAYKAFAQLGTETPKRIIDGIYAANKSRAAAGIDEWNGCMDPISGK